MIHHVPWPLSRLLDWMKAYFQSQRLKELIAIEQKQLLQESIPSIDVSVHLLHNPDPPRRSDIPIVDVAVKNYGGPTKITQARFWITRSDEPAYKEEKNLIDVEMPKGKEEKFSFTIKILSHQEIMRGHSILKFEYDLHFYGPNQQPEERKSSYRYDREKDAFIGE